MCAAHEAERKARVDVGRGTPAQRGYGGRWQRERGVYLKGHPWCAYPGCEERATQVDHIVPHRGDEGLFWDKGNWQGLCARHHSAKTRRGVGRG